MLALARTTIIVFLIGFFALFAVRLAYDFHARPDREVQRPAGLVGMFSSGSSGRSDAFSFGSGVKNYASRKLAVTRAAAQGGGGGGAAVSQKYEKVANVGLISDDFETDEARVRDLIKSEKALIQFEQRRGLLGARVLRLTIGVGPDLFDGFVAKAQTFGKLSKLTINKIDKTTEYRQLKAKSVSLEKARTALAELKERDGEVPAMIELEKQILALEQQIQSLGVNLGDFDSENEFVTVKMVIAEAGPIAVRSVHLAKRVFDALLWTAQVYALLLVGLAAALFVAFVTAHLTRLGMSIAERSENSTSARPA